jgi:hypothetical protein
MGLTKKDTFSKTVTNGTLDVPSFNQGWIANDGGGDLTLTFANNDVLVLKPLEQHRWEYMDCLFKGYKASGVATTFRVTWVS